MKIFHKFNAIHIPKYTGQYHSCRLLRLYSSIVSNESVKWFWLRLYNLCNSKSRSGERTRFFFYFTVKTRRTHRANSFFKWKCSCKILTTVSLHICTVADLSLPNCDHSKPYDEWFVCFQQRNNCTACTTTFKFIVQMEKEIHPKYYSFLEIIGDSWGVQMLVFLILPWF